MCSRVPSATLVEDIGTEVSYVLPNEAAHSGALERLFTDLDQNMHALGVSSYGVSDTTLEEVGLEGRSIMHQG